MIEREARGRDYQTSIDRAGLSLATGGLLSGLIVAGMIARGGDHSAIAIVAAFALGSVFAALGIAAAAGPAWLAMHLLGWRGPAHAAAAGVAIGFVLALAAQASGLNAGDGDSAITALNWLRAAGSSMMLATLAGLIALAMWRVAYRRVE